MPSPKTPPQEPDPPQGESTCVEADPDITQADGDDDDPLFSSAASTASSTTSLSDSVFEYRQLHGRPYKSTKTTEYWAPTDNQQNEGLDLIHHASLMLFDDRLILAPMDDNPQRILDVGTGTGAWATDCGDEFPMAEVIGTDISPIQPSWVPPNVKFEIDDCLEDWTWPEDHFDLVHARALYGVIPSWSDLYAKAFRHLKSGGWFQALEMDVKIESDHVNFPADHIFNRWANLIYKAGEKLGCSFTISQGQQMKQYMTDAGFVDVAEKKVKAPLHRWPKDENLRRVGLLLQAAFDASLDGFGTFLFTQVLGLSREEVVVLTWEMRQESRKVSNLHWFMV